MKKFILGALIAVVVFIFAWVGASYVLNRNDGSQNPNPTETISASPQFDQGIQLYLPSNSDKTVGTKSVIYGKGVAFENTINYEISDKTGKRLAFGAVMTNAPDVGKFGYFHQEINLSEVKNLPSDIVLEVFESSAKDGSKLNINRRELKVDQSSTALFVYFSNNNLDPEVSCNETFAVSRLVPKTQLVLKTSMEELLKGPTAQETQLGFTTSINSGVTLNSAKISGSTATVDFSPRLDENMGGSCRVAAIRNQITRTAKQFSSIKNVTISINGESETILQP